MKPRYKILNFHFQSRQNKTTGRNWLQVKWKLWMVNIFSTQQRTYLDSKNKIQPGKICKFFFWLSSLIGGGLKTCNFWAADFLSLFWPQFCLERWRYLPSSPPDASICEMEAWDYCQNTSLGQKHIVRTRDRCCYLAAAPTIQSSRHKGKGVKATF